MGCPRQEYWSRLPFPSPGDLPNPRIKRAIPAMAGEFFTTEPPGKLHFVIKQYFLAERSYSTFKVSRGGCEEIPLVQGKEQAAALCWSSLEEIPHGQGKRKSSKTVGVKKGHQRADRLKP